MGWLTRSRNCDSKDIKTLGVSEIQGDTIRKKRVLLCTRDAGLRSLLVHLLCRNHYDVICLGRRMEILWHVMPTKVHPAIIPPPDIMIIDGRCGLKTLRFLRKVHGDTTLVVLTAVHKIHWLNDLNEVEAVIESIRPVRWASLMQRIESADIRNPGRQSCSSRNFWKKANAYPIAHGIL